MATEHVGVVIPTRSRPDLVVRAVRSVLAQTHRALEVVVVVDGPDDETTHALAGIDDSRLRVAVVPQRGAPAARNTGARLVTADWVAFLDDDDTWHPRKLEIQLQAARASTARFPVVSCKALKAGSNTAGLYPERLPGHDEPISEYLFSPCGLGLRGGAQTSTLLVPRVLTDRIPFDEALPRHQDWDWLLRAASDPDFDLIVVDQVLAEWHVTADRKRISNSRQWRYSYDWIRARRDMVTPRAYAGFLLTILPINATRAGAGIAPLMMLFREALKGRPTFVHLMVFAGWLLVPDRLIRWSARLLRKS